jgi:hypothetical protein
MAIQNFKNIVDLQTTITDPVIQSFPLILKVSDSRFALYYISSTKQYGIKCKILDGLNLSEEFEIFSGLDFGSGVVLTKEGMGSGTRLASLSCPVGI